MRDQPAARGPRARDSHEKSFRKLLVYLSEQVTAIP